LSKLFAGQAPAGVETVLRHEYQHPELGIVRQPKRAKTLAYTARKFCRDCNSGWMNELDQRARPSLEAFAANRPMTLSPADQETLAFWTTKTLFGFLSTEPDEYQFAPPELYQELYRTRAPLVGSQVWVGANAHGDIAWQRAHSLVFRTLGDDARGFGASLSFGYGVLHLIHHGSPDWLLRLRYDAHRSLRQVWPTQPSVEWPPDLRMQPRDLTPLPQVINANSTFVRRG